MRLLLNYVESSSSSELVSSDCQTLVQASGISAGDIFEKIERRCNFCNQEDEERMQVSNQIVLSTDTNILKFHTGS